MSGWVLGCHRSGTSLLSGLLRASLPDSQEKILGLDIPDSLANPYGHHESEKVCASNEQILNWASARWDRPFLIKPDWSCQQSIDLLSSLRPSLKTHCGKGLWIDKDPRLCLTRDAWLHILLKDIPAIAIIRNPFAVAESLFRRDGYSLAKAGLIWILYNLHLFDARASAPKKILLFDELVLGRSERDPKTISDLQEFLEMVFLDSDYSQGSINPERIGELLDRHADSSLIRSEARGEVTEDAALAKQLERIWHRVSSAARDRCSAGDLAKLFGYAWTDCSPWLSPLLAEPLRRPSISLTVDRQEREDLLSRLKRRIFRP